MCNYIVAVFGFEVGHCLCGCLRQFVEQFGEVAFGSLPLPVGCRGFGIEVIDAAEDFTEGFHRVGFVAYEVMAFVVHTVVDVSFNRCDKVVDGGTCAFSGLDCCLECLVVGAYGCGHIVCCLDEAVELCLEHFVVLLILLVGIGFAHAEVLFMSFVDSGHEFVIFSL